MNLNHNCRSQNFESNSALQKNDMQKILVTGASGFIGSRLMRPNYIGLVRKLPDRDGFIYGDLLDIDTLLRAFKGMDVIYHCAGYAHAFGKADSSLHWKINFEGTRNLLRAAASCGVKKIIYFSSVKAGEEYLTPYGQSKLAAENEILGYGKEFGIHVVNLRLSMVYGGGSRGNLERMIWGIKRGWFPPLPEFNNYRSLIHVDDVVSAVHFVTNCPNANGNTYILTDGGQYSTHHLYQEIRKGLGLPPARRFISKYFLKYSGLFGDLIGATTGINFPVNSEVVERLTQSEIYISDKISQELGWQPRVSLEEGLRESIAFINAKDV